MPRERKEAHPSDDKTTELIESMRSIAELRLMAKNAEMKTLTYLYDLAIAEIDRQVRAGADRSSI